MNYRLILCLLLIVVMVGTVSADTLIVYTSGNGDGYIAWGGSVTGKNWLYVRNDTSSSIGGGSVLLTSTENRVRHLLRTNGVNDVYYFGRNYFGFNTSSLPDDSTIESATAGFYGHATTGNTCNDTPTLGITGYIPVANGTLEKADYGSWQSTRLASDIAYANWAVGSYNNYTLNSDGKNWISKTAYTNIVQRFGTWDIDVYTPDCPRNAATSIYTQMSEHGDHAPFLEITYSSGVSAPVASFTCTKNFIRIPNSVTCTDSSTNTPTSWEWSWGDGTANSTTQNPSHQYLKRGKWDIVMTATNAGGSSTTSATSVKVVGYENYY